MPVSEVHNEDCMEGMKRYPDKFFSLAVVDPPYGIDVMNSGGQPASQNFINWERKDWDKCIPDADYFKEVFRVSVNQIIWGGNYFVNYISPSMGWLSWDKMQDDFSGSDFELAWSSFDKAARVFRMSRAQAYCNQEKVHPTQKPVKLYRWLLTNYAKPGDKILDTHLGSQSSRIAAYDMGFDFTGFEIDKDYFEAGNKRFENFKKQLKLF